MNIHYFQRYSQLENTVTSNTMLMFSRLYDANHASFYGFLHDLIGVDNQNLDLNMTLQPRGANSTPDASIEQVGFKVIIETKLHGAFTLGQLERHLDRFKDSHSDINVLLTIDTNPLDDKFLTQFSAKLKQYNDTLADNQTKIIHIHRSFANIIDLMQNHIDNRDYQLCDVFEDFKQYCLDTYLIDKSYEWMRALAVGTTLDSNIKTNLYYDGYNRGFSKHGYIGLYTNKCVVAIGKCSKIAVGYTDENGKYVIEPEDKKEKLTDEEEKRILQAVEDSKQYYNSTLLNVKHRFFLVEKFYPTNYKKTSPYGLQKCKYFNLHDILSSSGEISEKDKLPATDVIAEALKNITWE